MTFPKKWSWLLSGGLCGMVLLAGCSSNTRHKWLTFFFDGVPGPQVVPAAAQPEHPQGKNNEGLILTGPAPLKVGPQSVVHKPYAERQCMECHASNYSQRLKGDVSAVCTACHKAFLVKAQYTHAPVEDGQCTICHAPHQSKEPFLLLKNIRELCFDCHEPEIVFNTKSCAASLSDGRFCTECHDPHQEDRRFLLLPPGKTSPVRKMAPEK